MATNNILDLPRDQFLASLNELAAQGVNTDELMRQYRRANSPFSGLFDWAINSERDIANEGRTTAGAGLFSKEAGTTGMDALASTRIEPANFIAGLLSDAAFRADAPAAALKGLIPPSDMQMEALGLAGFAQLGGAAAPRPAGSVGMGGRIVDFNAARSNRARNELINKIEGAVDDVQSGAYRQRLDAAGFDLHRQGNLPLPVGSRVRPPRGWDMEGDWSVDGYWIDQQNPQRYGYKLINSNGDTYDAPVSDPQLGYRTDDPSKFGGGFTAYAGPRGEALSYPDRPPMERPQSEPLSPKAQAEWDAFWNELSSNRDATTGAIALPAARNEAERMARQILEMRAAGRAGEVTDAMMAQADPQYMFNNTPLPMDEASRMARAGEMGLLDDAYHATGAEFQQFIPSQVGRHGAGVYTGKNVSDVQTFLPRDEVTRRYAEGSQVLPLRIPDNAQMASEMKWQNALPERWNYGDPKDVYDAISGYAEAADTLSQSDFKGVTQPATDWDGRVIFDPTNIRSRFARFDPEFSHLANLNAANASPLAGILAMPNEEERNRQLGLLFGGYR